MSDELPATGDGEFAGFAPLEGNFLYCPNQFFEVCLRNHSRGAVRLVGYLLLKTLGWLDGKGLPVEQQIRVTYRELIAHAGISRGALSGAIDEAIIAKFIERVATSPAATFALRWDSGDAYQMDSRTFAGIYAGEGYRSPIPLAYFSQILPQEPLSVSKVVGAVLRHTVGYRNQFGGFRPDAPLSYSYLQQYVNLSDRKTLAKALKRAQTAGYIRRVSAGRFANDPEKRQAACYAVRWLSEAQQPASGSKTPPAPETAVMETSVQKPHQPSSSKGPPASVQNPHQQPFKNPTQEKRTIAIHNSNKTSSVVENQQGIELLLKVGFDQRTAHRLAQDRLPAEIEQQIQWLPLRNPSQNPLGLLRRAIEENWSAPAEVQGAKIQAAARKREDQSLSEQQALEHRRAVRKRQTEERRAALLGFWNGISDSQEAEYRQQAIDRAASDLDRRRLRRSTRDQPEIEILEAMARDLNLPSI